MNEKLDEERRKEPESELTESLNVKNSSILVNATQRAKLLN